LVLPGRMARIAHEALFAASAHATVRLRGLSVESR
jgi:hypothetical protein